jgi:hypothetical protein
MRRRWVEGTEIIEAVGFLWDAGSDGAMEHANRNRAEYIRRAGVPVEEFSTGTGPTTRAEAVKIARAALTIAGDRAQLVVRVWQAVAA